MRAPKMIDVIGLAQKQAKGRVVYVSYPDTHG